MSDAIHIVIADDHSVLRRGLKQVIEEDPRLRVVGEADDGEEALEQIATARPDIAVLDVEMPKLDGFAVLRKLQESRATTSVIFLTFHADGDLFDEAMTSGAKGYVLKENAAATIVEAVTAVVAGQHYVTPSMSDHLLRHRARPGARRATPRARQPHSHRAPDPAARRPRGDEQGDRQAAVRALPHGRELPTEHLPEARPRGPQCGPEVRPPAPQRAVAGELDMGCGS